MRPRIFGTRKDWQLAEKFVASRRDFLMAGGSLAILPLASQIAPGAVRSRTAWASDPFTLGVASGEPSSSGMVLWTRLLIDPVNIGGNPKGPIEVVWELSDDPSMKTILKSGKVLTTEALGHSVHVQVHGLESNRWYWYRFHSGDASSPIGRRERLLDPSRWSTSCGSLLRRASITSRDCIRLTSTWSARSSI